MIRQPSLISNVSQILRSTIEAALTMTDDPLTPATDIRPRDGCALVVGATGGVGRPLLRGLAGRFRRVYGTSRRGGDGLLPFDLAANRSILDVLPVEPIELAVIAAAQTRADACERDPVGARQTNVTGTIELIRQLQSRGILPIFLSSDYVFGERGDAAYFEDSAACPANEYGRQKVEVEQALQSSGRPYAVFRLGRVLLDEPGGGGLLDEACDRLLAGTPYSAADDQCFSTTTIDDLVQGILLAASGKLRGLVHVAAHPTNRYELVLRICRALGTAESLVRRCRLRDVLGQAPRSACTTIESRRLGREVPFRFTAPQSAIDRIAAARIAGR